MSPQPRRCKHSRKPTDIICALPVAQPSPPARPSRPHPEISWWGWGDPSQVPAFAPEHKRLLVDALGVRPRVDGKAPSFREVRLAPPRISAEALSELGAAVGEEHALIDDESRIRHTRGKSTPDLLRLRSGDASGAPDLVLMPTSPAQVLDVLAICTQRRIAVVPFGGGTSVVGGLEPRADDFAGLVALDTQRMSSLLALDEESRIAKLEAGLRGPQAELLLQERGYTIGHHPQSFEYATLGGFAAARSSGQASSGYGRFDQLVLGLELATPVGTLSLGRAPASAAGPDLRQLILGSEGTLGVITAMTLQVRPIPAVRIYEGWRFRSFREGLRVVRKLAQDGPLPTVLRLSDEAETALNLARPERLAQSMGEPGSLAIVGYEGTAEEAAARRDGVARVLESAGALSDPAAGEAWQRERYRGPYLRDALLAAGALVETVETAGFWSTLPELYESAGGAIRDSLTALGTPPVTLCHVSHIYPAGASLYFTVGCAQLDDPVAQWRAAKRATSDAILRAGGTISHHHGVGLEHREWLEREIGELGVRLLRTIKAELDPAGILNPGVLIPDR